MTFAGSPRGFTLPEPYRQAELDVPIEQLSPEDKPEPYPWPMIQHVKAAVGIDPRDRAVRYLPGLFEGWTCTHEDCACPARVSAPRACICGQNSVSFSQFTKTVGGEDVDVLVGQDCGCADFFYNLGGLSAEFAMDQLRSNGVYVAYVGPSDNGRHKFEILPTTETFNLFNEELIEYYQKFHKYFFVYGNDDAAWYVEAKLNNELAIRGLREGNTYDAQLMPEVYCTPAGSGIEMRVRIFNVVTQKFPWE